MGSTPLKVFLVQKDIRLKELSSATGLPVPTLSAICNGRKPKISSALTISDCLGVHPSKIFPNLFPYASIKKRRTV